MNEGRSYLCEHAHTISQVIHQLLGASERHVLIRETSREGTRKSKDNDMFICINSMETVRINVYHYVSYMYLYI